MGFAMFSQLLRAFMKMIHERVNFPKTSALIAAAVPLPNKASKLLHRQAYSSYWGSGQDLSLIKKI